MSLAANLKAIRKERSLSQLELAIRSEVSLGTVAGIEQGHNDDVKLSTIRALARGLGVDPGELVTALHKPSPRAKKAR